MLYFADINPMNIYICKLLLDPNDQYRLNYYEGDTLELDINTEFKIDKFNVIIGNPPYNKGLYIKFTEKMLNIGKKLLFVIPSSFTIGVSYKKFINFLKNNGLHKMVFLERSAFCNKVDIDTLYLYCNQGYNDKIIVNNVEIERVDPLLNYNKTTYNILRKLSTGNMLSLKKGKNKTLPYKKQVETSNIKFTKSKDTPHEMISRLGNGNITKYYISSPVSDISGNKIIFPRGTASYNNKKRLLDLSRDIVYSTYIEKDIHISTGLVYIQVEDEDQSQILKWYLLRSKLVRFLFLNLNYFSELTVGFVNKIPVIPLDVEWCDDTIFEYFDLDENEKSYINSIFTTH
jgi:hypothetical protein